MYLREPKNKDRPQTGYYDFDTPQEAYEFIAKMRKDGHKVPDNPKDYKSQRHNYKPLEGSLDKIIDDVTQSRKELISLMLAGQAPDDAITDIEKIMDMLPTDITDANDVVRAGKNEQMRKKFVAGREDMDMVEQFRKSNQRRAAAIMRRATDTKFKLYKNDRTILENVDMYNVLDDFRQTIRYKDTEAQTKIANAGFMMFIAGNISSGLVEMFQYPITLSPILIEAGSSVKDAYNIPRKMMVKAAHAAITRARSKSDADIWTDQQHVKLLRTAEDQGALNQRKHTDVSNDSMDKMVTMLHGEQDITDIKGKAMSVANLTAKYMRDSYAFFNRINAELALVSTYEVLKKQHPHAKNLSDLEMNQLFDKAILLSDVANGSLQRLGRPSMGFSSRREGVRNMASAYWSLQSFVNAQIANQLRFMSKSVNSNGLWTKGEQRQAQKAMAGMLGVQFAGMGIMGFTLMPSIGKLVEQLFGVDMEDELRELLYDKTAENPADATFMGEVAANGFLTAAGFPIDYGTRISVAGFGPLSGYDGLDMNQLGGPLVGLATQAFRDINRVRTGSMQPGEAALNLLPMGLRRGVRMSFFDDGQILDANKRYMFTPGAGEKFGTWLGFNTRKARQEMKARMERDEAIKSDYNTRSAIAGDINQARATGSPQAIAQRVYEGAKRMGEQDPYKIAAFAAERYVDKIKGPDIREGSGPASAQARKLYPSPMGNENHLDRLASVAGAIQQSGFTPKISASRVNNARALDMIQSAMPDLTSGMARKIMGQNPYAVRSMLNQRNVASLQELLQGVDPDGPP